MPVYVALFRGINVGGRSLPMKDLTRVLEHNGCTEVQTYIQSGNAVFRSAVASGDRLARRISAAVAKQFGFEPPVLVLTRGELERAAANNPFPEAESSPQTLHLFFLAGPATKADVKALEALRAGRERFALKGAVFYLHAPDGFGTSKLAARAERRLGVDATARNWRTVMALLEMAGAH